jgi:hypothetical protein
VGSLPGQAFFNAHYERLAAVYRWVARVLGVVLIVLAVAKIRGGWLSDQLGGIKILSMEDDFAPGSEEAFVLHRGTSLLLLFVGLQLLIRTLPDRKGKEGGAASAAESIMGKAGKAD